MTAILIRDEKPADQHGIERMHERAFGGPAEAQLVRDLRTSGDAAISLIAVSGDEIVGHILLSRLKAPMKALTLAPLAVHPEFQRRGIGLDLLRKGLSQAKNDGFAAVFVLGDIGYYERVGFTVSAGKGFASPFAGEHFMALSFDPDNMPDNGTLIYPAPFEGLK